MKRWLVFLMSGLLVFSLACSALGGLFDGDDATSEPVATETSEATEEAEETAEMEETEEAEETEEVSPEAEETEETPTEEADEDAPVPKISESKLDSLDSYRSRIEVSMDFEDGTSQALVFEQAVTREPVAQHIIMTGEIEGESFEFEAVQIEKKQWTRFGDEWMQTETEEVADLGEEMVLSFEDFTDLAADEDFELVGEEEIDGVNTRHYELRLSAEQMAELTASDEIDDVSAEIWIANEADLPDYPVRFILEAEGRIEGDKQGTMTFTQEVYDVNEPFVIEPPEDAGTGGLPEDVPLYADAQIDFSSSGMTMFSVEDDVATVAEFYETALADNGWTQSETSDLAGMVMDTWTKDDRELQLTITESDEGGTNVMITITEGE
jgi:hypothetical protein